MISNIKISIKYAFNIKHWIIKLLKRFKEKSNVAFFTLIKKRYIVENVKNQRKFRKYALIILKIAKSTNFVVADQITMIWNNRNVEFQRNIYRLNKSTILNYYLNSLNEFKNIWWQFARRKMFVVYRKFNYRTNQYHQFDDAFKFY